MIFIFTANKKTCIFHKNLFLNLTFHNLDCVIKSSTKIQYTEATILGINDLNKKKIDKAPLFHSYFCRAVFGVFKN